MKDKEFIYGHTERDNGDILYEVYGSQNLIFKRGVVEIDLFATSPIGVQQVSADWNATSGVSQIANKPTDEQVIDWTVDQSDTYLIDASNIVLGDLYDQDLNTDDSVEFVNLTLTGSIINGAATLVLPSTTGTIALTSDIGSADFSSLTDTYLPFYDDTAGNLDNSPLSFNGSYMTSENSFYVNNGNSYAELGLIRNVEYSTGLFRLWSNKILAGSPDGAFILQNNNSTDSIINNLTFGGDNDEAFITFNGTSYDIYHEGNLDLTDYLVMSSDSSVASTSDASLSVGESSDIIHIQSLAGKVLAINPLGNTMTFSGGTGNTGTTFSSGAITTDGTITLTGATDNFTTASYGNSSNWYGAYQEKITGASLETGNILTLTRFNASDLTVDLSTTLSLSSGSGTTANGSAVDLGGTLTTDFTLTPDADGSHGIRLGNGNTERVNSFVVFAETFVGFQSGGTNDRGFLNSYGKEADDSGFNGMEFGWFKDESYLMGFWINLFDDGNFEVVDNISSKGLTYAGDYTANFIDRSLPDVAWVNDQLDDYLGVTTTSTTTKSATNAQVSFGEVSSVIHLQSLNGYPLAFNPAGNSVTMSNGYGNTGTTFNSGNIQTDGAITLGGNVVTTSSNAGFFIDTTKEALKYDANTNSGTWYAMSSGIEYNSTNSFFNINENLFVYGDATIDSEGQQSILYLNSTVSDTLGQASIYSYAGTANQVGVIFGAENGISGTIIPYLRLNDNDEGVFVYDYLQVDDDIITNGNFVLDSTYDTTIQQGTQTANTTLTLPSESGTIALTTDVAPSDNASLIYGGTAQTVTTTATAMDLTTHVIDGSNSDYSVNLTNNTVTFTNGNGGAIYEITMSGNFDTDGKSSANASRSYAITEARVSSVGLYTSTAWTYVREFQGTSNGIANSGFQKTFLYVPSAGDIMDFTVQGVTEDSLTLTDFDLANFSIIIKKLNSAHSAV